MLNKEVHWEQFLKKGKSIGEVFNVKQMIEDLPVRPGRSVSERRVIQIFQLNFYLLNIASKKYTNDTVICLKLSRAFTLQFTVCPDSSHIVCMKSEYMHLHSCIPFSRTTW